MDTVELAFEESMQNCSSDQTEYETPAHEYYSFAEDQLENVPGGTAKRDSNPDLPGALFDEIRKHSINSDG